MDNINRIFQGLSRERKERFEFYNYGHAFEILTQAFPYEWDDLGHIFDELVLTKSDIVQSGGNESPIPKKIDDILYPKGWREIRISGDLIIKQYPRQIAQRRGAFSTVPFEKTEIKGYIDGHNIDFLKSKVAFDLEWNSKDQTFDRDLLAMRTYFDCGIIDVGIIMTRSVELNLTFREMGVLAKYGASTTWIGKLLPRLDSRRNGGCPILAVGIRRSVVDDSDIYY